MCPSSVVEDVLSSEVDKEDAVRQLLRAVLVAKLKKAEQDWQDSIRWWTNELAAGRMPMDLRLRSAANLSSALEELRKVNQESDLA